MKLRIARLGVLLAAVLGLMATMVPSAQATTYKLITFTGEAVLSAGLGYPCTPAGTTDCTTATTTTKPGPKKEDQVLLDPGGNTAGFVFASTVCVKTSVSTPSKGPNAKTGPADICVLTASGVVTGYCGLSTGMGTAKLVNLTSAKDLLETDFKFTGVGGVLHVTGGDKETNIYAEVSAVPAVNPPGGPSCTNKTGRVFTLTGVAYYKDCTNGTVTVEDTLTGLCNVP